MASHHLAPLVVPDPCHVVIVREEGGGAKHLWHVVIKEEATNSCYPYIGHQLVPSL
jgi:hypothetical protein